MRTTLCSPRGSAHPPMPHTSGAPSARWSRPQGWTLAGGRRASCGTASSLLSDAGVPIEQISRLVGHSGTTTTETIYRKQIRPVLVRGADAMDRIFPLNQGLASAAESNQED